jgi:uncharacterized protein YukE
MADVIQHHYESMNAGVSAIKSFTAKVQHELDDLKTAAAPLFETWSGQAQTVWVQTDANIRKALLELNGTHARQAAVMVNASDSFRSIDNQMGNSFSQGT